jgi:hypothetical protein
MATVDNMDKHSLARVACVLAAVLAVAATRPTVARADPAAVIEAAPPAGSIHLMLVTHDPGVSLQRVLPDGTRLAVCAAPCNQAVPRRDIYVMAEDGAAKSPRFSLPETDRELTLTVRRESPLLRVTGGTLIAVGFLAQFAAFVMIGGDPSPEEMMREANHPPSVAPLAVGLGGIVAAGVGAYLYWRGYGRVESSTGRSFGLTP